VGGGGGGRGEGALKGGGGVNVKMSALDCVLKGRVLKITNSMMVKATGSI
jgi:hypothetical protein